MNVVYTVNFAQESSKLTEVTTSAYIMEFAICFQVTPIE